MLNQTKLYTCIVRLRSVKLEQLYEAKVITPYYIHDSFDIEFQSLDLDKAKNYYNNNIQPYRNEYWYMSHKYLVESDLDSKIEEGLVNENCILDEDLTEASRANNRE